MASPARLAGSITRSPRASRAFCTPSRNRSAPDFGVSGLDPAALAARFGVPDLGVSASDVSDIGWLLLASFAWGGVEGRGGVAQGLETRPEALRVDFRVRHHVAFGGEGHRDQTG